MPKWTKAKALSELNDLVGQVESLKDDVRPGTGDILIHLFSRPPIPESKRIPASEETGIRIGLAAGARYKAIHDVIGVIGGSLVRAWALPRQGRRSACARAASVR